MQKTFGRKLWAYRNAAGEKLSELARRTGYSKSYLSELENDKKDPPSIDVIEAIAGCLGADLWDLLRAAGKEVDYIVQRKPEAADFLRRTRDYGPNDWKKIGQLADIAGLGKGEQEEE